MANAISPAWPPGRLGHHRRRGGGAERRADGVFERENRAASGDGGPDGADAVDRADDCKGANEIDKMVTRFKKSNAEFYNGYFAARVIVNRARGLSDQ